MDAHRGLALRVPCGLERLSVGCGCRAYPHTFTPPAPAGSRLAAPAGSRLAARARPSPGRRQGQPMCGGLVPESTFCCCAAYGVACWRYATCCAGHLLCCFRPVFPAVTNQAAGSVSSSRRLGYQQPEWTFGKATPTRSRPGWHSFFIQASVPLQCCLFSSNILGLFHLSDVPSTIPETRR